MRYVADRSGRFTQRPHYEPKELDRECEAIVSAFLRERHGSVAYPLTTDDLTVLIERDTESLDQYADLSAYGRFVEGVTQFQPGRKPKVLISETLSTADNRQNRLRMTLAHEYGHVRFHAPLWDLEPPGADLLKANPRHLSKSAKALARAQRAGRKAIARKINRKIAAQRRHFLHQASARIAKANGLICVGDVNSAALARTRMAKSVLDAGWSAFRSQLRYKAMRHGARFVEVSERYTTQTCSCCGSRDGSPRGVKGLRVRDWTCDGCGARHDRDTNAAINILVSGRNAALLQTEILGPRAAGRH